MNNPNQKFNLNALIPQLAEWNEGHGIDIVAWIQCIGSYEHAIAYARLFWPDFVEYNGCILFADFNRASYEGFLKQAGGNKKTVEMVMNHEHISDMFPNQEPTENQVIFLGRLLKDMWQAKLNTS